MSQSPQHMKWRMPGKTVGVKRIVLASWRLLEAWVSVPCLLRLCHCPALLPQPSSGPWNAPLGLPSSPAPAPAAKVTGSRVTKEVAQSCFLLVLSRRIFRPHGLHCSPPTWPSSVFSLRLSSNFQPCQQDHVYQPDHLRVEESLL